MTTPIKLPHFKEPPTRVPVATPVPKPPIRIKNPPPVGLTPMPTVSVMPHAPVPKLGKYNKQLGGFEPPSSSSSSQDVIPLPPLPQPSAPSSQTIHAGIIEEPGVDYSSPKGKLIGDPFTPILEDAKRMQQAKKKPAVHSGYSSEHLSNIESSLTRKKMTPSQHLAMRRKTRPLNAGLGDAPIPPPAPSTRKIVEALRDSSNSSEEFQVKLSQNKTLRKKVNEGKILAGLNKDNVMARQPEIHREKEVHYIHSSPQVAPSVNITHFPPPQEKPSSGKAPRKMKVAFMGKSKVDKSINIKINNKSSAKASISGSKKKTTAKKGVSKKPKKAISKKPKKKVVHLM